jgi:hypothetical protein
MHREMHCQGVLRCPERGQWYGRIWCLVTWELFGKIAGQYGVPAAAMLFVLWLSMTGRVIWQREALRSEKDRAELRKDYERQLAEMTTDRDYYREMTMTLMQRYDREIGTSEAAVGTAVRALRRRS